MKKVKFVCKNDFCKKEFEISEKIVKFRKLEFYSECKQCRNYKKNCPICNKIHNKQGLTCCSKCANKLKENKYIESCGARHNLCKESISRKKIQKNLMDKYGVTNVFQRQDVKDKIIKHYMDKYGVTHNTHTKDYIINKRKNGIYIPLDELTEYQIYRNNVISFTNFNLKYFGDMFFGDNWEDDRNFFNKQIDHRYSTKMGYLDKIEPYIIGSIVNLDLIPYKKNLSKKDKCSITKEELYGKYKDFEKTNEELIKYKIKIRNIHENKKNTKKNK